MLDHSKNKLLTEVGRGTPMGELMRRYWHPIGAVSEFDERSTRPVRLMGEDLVLYKDLSGNFGLVDRLCPHRSADLSYGFVEQCGLRCNYHGWLWDRDGKCLAQPYEEAADPGSRFKEKVKIKAYPVEQKAGLLWTYLGPLPAPLLPEWEPFTWTNGFVQIVMSEVPCNWLQCQENSCDPVHFEWMHSNWSIRLGGETGPYSPAHVKINFDEFEYGIIYRRVRQDTDEEHPLWKIGRACLWPNALFTGGHFEWRVPIDDTHTLSVGWFFDKLPKDREPYVQNHIPSWWGPIEEPDSGRWISSHVMNQDFIAWVGQGTVTDRRREHLGMSDRGVIMLRKIFMDDIEKVARGEDPKGLIRDPEKNRSVQLPIIGLDVFRNGMTREQLNDPSFPFNRVLNGFPFQAGQPEHVRKAFEDAIGQKVGDGNQVRRAAE